MLLGKGLHHLHHSRARLVLQHRAGSKVKVPHQAGSLYNWTVHTFPFKGCQWHTCKTHLQNMGLCTLISSHTSKKTDVTSREVRIRRPNLLPSMFRSLTWSQICPWQIILAMSFHELDCLEPPVPSSAFCSGVNEPDCPLKVQHSCPTEHAARCPFCQINFWQ